MGTMRWLTRIRDDDVGAFRCRALTLLLAWNCSPS
jgi:hypothetical protein